MTNPLATNLYSIVKLDCKLVIAVALPVDPAGNVLTCVAVFPLVGVIVVLLIKLGINPLIHVIADTVFGTTVANCGSAAYGCTTVLRSSSPTSAV